MKIVLETFAEISGLRVNPTKSSVFLSANADLRVVLDVLAIEKGLFSTRYLGVPLFTSMLTKKLCEPLVDKIKTKLESWKLRHLSMAGRVELIVSTLSSYHLYWTAVFTLPTGTISEIERLCCSFRWGDTEDKKHIHIVAWEDICKPKDEGGLEI